jgi:thiamine biosynthesis lipoprotein
MGSQMLAAIDSEGAGAATSLAGMPLHFAAWEQSLSRFREDSDLSKLNRSQGRPVRVNETLWEVVTAALQAAQLTEGLITPAVLPALEESGYTRSFDTLPPDLAISPKAVVDTLAVADWRAIKLDPRTRSISLPEGMRIDLGGIAKGWAADRAAEELGKHGPALVDAGGDIAVSGPMSDDSAWPIGVADPLKDGEQIDLIMLRRGGVATSGRDYRKWRQDGVWKHHIIDPRTGQPAGTDVLSATVIARNAQEAEVAAKSVLIQGSAEGLAWLDARPHLAGLVVLEDGRVLRSRLLKYYVWD